jgi:hypothetical protein
MMAIVLLLVLTSGLTWLMLHHPGTKPAAGPDQDQVVAETGWTALDERQLRRLLDSSP